MPEFEFVPRSAELFVGREDELRQLDSFLYDRRMGATLFVVGDPGVGKSALVRHWLHTRRISGIPIWGDLEQARDASIAINELTTFLHEQRRSRSNDYIVTLDHADVLSEEQYAQAIRNLGNVKAVRSLIFTARIPPRLARKPDTFPLGPLSDTDTAAFVASLHPAPHITAERMDELVKAAKGNPGQIQLLIDYANQSSGTSFPLYDLSRTIAVPSTEIITAVAPIIVTANASLLEALKRQPEDIHRVHHRKFEELLADLLADMGYEVELTQSTRDGGTDILAYLNTELGRLLCLVEAKHFRKDRPVGVELVRALYGTLSDVDATSAMLVTSSYFSPDAHEFQRRHSYKLALRDYADVVRWIMKYGTKPKHI